MKINLDWLREFVAIDMPGDALADELTMAGLEVDGVASAAPDFSGVIVAEILDKRPHPDADRLSLCRISDGAREIEIVCGAPNAATGTKVPFAPVGTELPGGLKIRAAKIRGVRSEGMLCSAKELGLAEDASGLFLLDTDAPVGQDLREYLRLDDAVLDIDLTPNRGDCFSVLGVAREIAARAGDGPLEESLACIEPSTDATFAVELSETEACPRFAGRVVTGIDAGARSPDWLRERLRRAGLRPIHPVVDITNYVMLEYGQPMHAYRLDRLDGAIDVRFARPGESLKLLDESTVTPGPDTLVIADGSGAIGLAGIMGGITTAVDAESKAIFFESAFFSPAALQGRARRFGMHTDASVRFERGVDPTGQERAIERATALLLEIAGGEAGPVVVAEDPAALPAAAPVALRQTHLNGRLGIDVPAGDVERLLGQLGMELAPADGGWQVTPPSYRFDIAIEDDLVEEMGRMVGYDRIPALAGRGEVRLGPAPESRVPADDLADLLVARGYTEIISYGFTSSATLARITGQASPVCLANPISNDLDALRSSLWPGLLRAAQHNGKHQMSRCRLFELGTVFSGQEKDLTESTRIAGLATGSRMPAHWEGKPDVVDFFDLKGDVEAVLAACRSLDTIEWRRAQHPSLNPSRSAALICEDATVGWVGELHPALQKEYDCRDTVVLFEIDVNAIASRIELPKFASFSRYPTVRRDLAVVVDDSVAVADLTKRVAEALGDALHDLEVFDVYRGIGIDTGTKSVGIGLILQDASRTLTDQESDVMINEVMRRLEQEFGARIRS